MKKFLKLSTSVLIIAIVLISQFMVSAVETAATTIKIGTATANIGDTVYVPISIENNPGVSGITATITYDSSALEFLEFTKGPAFTNYPMVKEHPKDNVIKFVFVEEEKDSINNDQIITFKFKVQDKAKAKLYKMDMKYTKGDVASRTYDSINTKIISGGVKVNYSPEAQNCPHAEYGKWSVVVKPTCEEKGIKERICSVCSKKDFSEISPTDHIYEEKWTIDTPATKTQLGVMTRHCKHCTATCDRLTFKFKDTTKENIKNQVGAEVAKNNYLEGLIKEQLPSNESSSKLNSSSDSTAVLDLPTASNEIILSEKEDEKEEQKEEQGFIEKNKSLLIILALILVVILIVVIIIVIIK